MATMPNALQLTGSFTDEPADVEVRVARSPEEVEALRDVWTALPVRDIDADIDYFSMVVAEGGQARRPYVLHIRDEGGRDILVVARIEDLALPLRIGYRTFGNVRLRAIVVSFDGILGTRSRADEELAFRLLLGSLKEGEADLVVMRNVNVAEDRYAAAIASTPWVFRGHGRPFSNRWFGIVTGSYDEFLKKRSAKTRSNLRRYDRVLQKKYENRLTLRRFERPEDLDKVCRDMKTVAALTYQQGIGVAFSDSPFERARMALCLEKGWSRTWMLYVDDCPVAFWSGMAYGDTFFSGNCGFDPEYSKDSVGRYTMLRMIEGLCEDPKLSYFDFGQGGWEYKASFGESQRLETEVLLSARRLRPMLLLGLSSLFAFVNSQGSELAARSKWVGRLKAQWRRGLSGAPQDT
jgi:Acetyltransferase (GNAT) domain